MAESFVDMFNKLKIVHCMCPKCDNITRVSDLNLRSNEKMKQTWLDKFDSKIQTQERKEEKFNEEESKIRDDAKKRGRLKVPKLISKSLDKNFVNLNLNPYDVKAVLHPIDFVVFDGMNDGQVKNVTLLSSKTKNTNLKNIHAEISKAITNKAYDWKIMRVFDDGKIEYK